MTIDEKIKDEKQQYDNNREAAKISVWSSKKNDKDDYLKGKEVLPPDQSRIIEQEKFSYSPLEKNIEKQIKTVEEQGKNK